jgi:hypothetical protein
MPCLWTDLHYITIISSYPSPLLYLARRPLKSHTVVPLTLGVFRASVYPGLHPGFQQTQLILITNSIKDMWFPPCSQVLPPEAPYPSSS